METIERNVRLGRDYPVKPVPFTAVHCDDVFWAPRIETNRTVTVPFTFEQCELSGRVDLFHRAARAMAGDPTLDRTPSGFPFDETDVYKVIEGAAYTLRVHPDPALEAYVDGLVAAIARAQEPDGYLYPARTIDPEHPHPWAGARRWQKERELSHELYNLGHLYEAAVAYQQATGKRELLAISLRSADMLAATFGPSREAIWPGHQITELALVKLYRATGDVRYLDLACFMLDQRGPDDQPGSGNPYNQSHAGVVAQTEAVGHAVRAVYMYSGMADVAAVVDERSYVRALERIWEDVVARKLYITGGIGATARGEAFGAAYDLPNLTAYCETCAAIGQVFWSQRMFLLHGDSSYIDVLERTLYNGLLSGVSLDGMRFFYDNPLESDGQHERKPWFGCACCPGNITRFLPSVPGYVYGTAENAIYVNLFVAGRAEVGLYNGHTVKLEQETRYPWDGAVQVRVGLEGPRAFAIKLRIPGWARGEVVPSDLYRFADQSAEAWTLTVNGSSVTAPLQSGYVVVSREWTDGDLIDLHLPMPVRRVVAHEAVAANRGRVALQRGPLVYCAEWPDNPAGLVRDLLLADETPFTAVPGSDTLGDIVILHGSSWRNIADDTGRTIRQEQSFTAIPYHTWANRGPGEMIVWLQRL